MPDLRTNRNASHWNNTTPQMHIDAARDLMATGGHGWNAATHALIALALIQMQALEEEKWGGSGGS